MNSERKEIVGEGKRGRGRGEKQGERKRGEEEEERKRGRRRGERKRKRGRFSFTNDYSIIMQIRCPPYNKKAGLTQTK